MSRRAQSNREAGFALAEAIAVLALSALILLTLLIATDLVSRNSAAAARRANDLEMLATGLTTLSADLEGTLNMMPGTGESQYPLFVGGAGSLGVAVPDDRSGRGRQSLLWFETRYRDGEGALIRSSAALLPNMSSFAEAQFGDSVVIAQGPWQYRFAYAQASAAGLVWTDSWSQEPTTPVAIRLEVLDGRGKRIVPSLTVRVHVDAADCAATEDGCGGGDSDADANADAQSDETDE